MRTIRGIVWLIPLLTVLLVAGCHASRPRADPLVMPRNFDVKLLDVLVCPENLTPVRLARQSEIDGVNRRISAGSQRRWDGAPATTSVEALLIRQDNKIGYEVRNGIPVMLIDQALVLDAAVGRPDPKRSRSR